MVFGHIVQAVLLVGFISIMIVNEKRSRRIKKLLKKYGASSPVRFKNRLRVKGITKTIDTIKDKVQPKDMVEYNSISKLYWVNITLVVSLVLFVIVSLVMYNMGLI
jgi:hypothetical protein